MKNWVFHEIFAFDAPNLKVLNDTLRALCNKVMGREETPTAKTAPAARYEGPTELYVDPSGGEAAGSYKSLREALASLNGRQIDKDIMIDLASGTTEYGELMLTGMSGSGSVSIYGDPDAMPKLSGGLRLNATPFQINLFGIHIDTAKEGIYATGCPMVDIARCKITGLGVDESGTRCVVAGRGANIVIRQTELYDCERSLFAEYGGVIAAFACKGNCRVGVTWATMYAASTMPCDSAEWKKEEYAGQVIEQDVTVDQGAGVQPETPAKTISFSYLKSDSYRGGWGWFADNDIRQGWDGKPIFGVIWFDAAAIKATIGTETVKQASLRLQMKTGVGRGVVVDVQLYGSDVSEDKTTAPSLTASYGTIGKARPGEMNELTIPAQAVEDIISGKTRALVLKSNDDRLYSGKNYSTNYARFSGSTSAGTDENICPRITVVYQ